MSGAGEGYDYSRYTALKLSLADGIMTVTLSNPGKKNAMSQAMNAELTTIWDDLLCDNDVRLIILTGDGGDFCSGADVGNLAANAAAAPVSRPVFPGSRNAKRHLYSLLDCEKPVLAKVRGVAYGVGATLALACDMVFAAKGARFCDSHIRVAGMATGDGGVMLWPLLVGMHRAKEYLMTGEPVSAELAESWGMINRCLPDEDLDAQVDAMARKLLALPPHAVNYTKASLNLAMRQMTGAAFETSLAYQIYTRNMQDTKEAARAFVEKRKGVFKGY